MLIATTPETCNQALRHLLRKGAEPSTDGQRIGCMMLSLWNGARYQADLEDLVYLDDQAARHTIHLLHFLFRSNVRLRDLISPLDMQPLVRQWGVVETSAGSEQTAGENPTTPEGTTP